jgi:hypothetical protein
MGILAPQSAGIETGAPARVRQARREWGAVLAVLAVGATPAEAVDVRNRDRTAREITINHSDGRSETITVAAGQTLANVCSDCVVLAETTSVEVRGNVTVRIERGEVSIDGKR